MSVIFVWDNKTASIFFNSILLDWKVNLIVASGRSFPIVFKSAGENKIKIKKKREFLRKIDFDKINFGKDMQFLLNVYISILYTHLDLF